VVVCRQVRIAEVRDGLPDGADRAAVTARFGLGKDHTDVHDGSLPRPGEAAQADADTRVGPDAGLSG
jgi:hypothetical protein